MELLLVLVLVLVLDSLVEYLIEIDNAEVARSDVKLL
jgi:hypothetical protein